MPQHRCPRRGCTQVVDNKIFACWRDWYALSKPVRDAIYATARLHSLHPDRRAAFDAAREEWS